MQLLPSNLELMESTSDLTSGPSGIIVMELLVNVLLTVLDVLDVTAVVDIIEVNPRDDTHLRHVRQAIRQKLVTSDSVKTVIQQSDTLSKSQTLTWDNQGLTNCFAFRLKTFKHERNKQTN